MHSISILCDLGRILSARLLPGHRPRSRHRPAINSRTQMSSHDCSFLSGSLTQISPSSKRLVKLCTSTAAPSIRPFVRLRKRINWQQAERNCLDSKKRERERRRRRRRRRSTQSGTSESSRLELILLPDRFVFASTTTRTFSGQLIGHRRLIGLFPCRCSLHLSVFRAIA